MHQWSNLLPRVSASPVGKVVDREARPIHIYDLRLRRSATCEQHVEYSVTVSKGTYVRVLVADIGRHLGTCAHVLSIRRESVGELRVEDAFTVRTCGGGGR